METPFDGTADQVAAAAITARDEGRLARALANRTGAEAVGAAGITLLHWAVLNRAESAVAALLADGADPLRPDDNGDTPLHYAAISEDPMCLTAMLGRQADLDVTNPVTGRTPLMEAILAQRHSNTRALVAAGADPNIADRTGDTALHIAAELDEHSIILDLLRAGADPTVRNAQDATFQRYLLMTPAILHPAAARRRIEQITSWLGTRGIPLE